MHRSPVSIGLVLAFLLLSAPSFGGTPFELELDFTPDRPNDSEPFLVILHGVAVLPSMTVEVDGALITVRFRQLLGAILPPPPEAFTISNTVGPLPAGAYTVELFAEDEPDPVLTTELLIVTGGPSLVTVPTLSSFGFATLVTALAAVGLRRLRRRHGGARAA